MAYQCRNDRNSFTMTPIESWSITKRRRIKCLLSCMTEWSMNYQDFCRLLQQILGPMVSWPTEQRGKINRILSLCTEWNINYPDFCGLFQELIAHKVAPQILLDAMNESDIDGELKEEEPSVHTTQEHGNYKANQCNMLTTDTLQRDRNEQEEEEEDGSEDIGIEFVNNNKHNVPLVAQEAIDEDCKFEDSEPDFEPDADLLGSIIQISNQYKDDDAIAAQCQQMEVNNENNIINEGNNKEDDNEQQQLLHTLLKEHILNEIAVQDEEIKQESIPSVRVKNKFIVNHGDEYKNDIQSTSNPPPPASQSAATFNINATEPQNRPPPNQMNPMSHIDTSQSAYDHALRKQENKNKIDVDDNDQQKSTASKPNHSEPDDDEIDEEKHYHDMKSTSNKPIICRQWTSSQPKGLNFQPKYRNHAKGNFYVSEIMKWEIAAKAKVKFYTVDANQDDVALLLYYIKESSAMQINDGQIRVVYGRDDKAIIVIDIDLQFRDGQKMYLIAERQKEEDRKLYGVDWQIVEMMTAKQLGDIGIDILPQSSRDRNWYKRALSYSPHNMSKAEIVDMLKRTNFRSKRFRKSKRNNNENKRMQIKERLLKSCCEQALHNKVSMPFPVVVIKNEKHWIEWKQIVGVYDVKTRENGWIAISLRYYEMKQEWKVEMIDDDGGVIYYKHRLVSLSQDDEYSYRYNELRKVNTSLDIL